MFEDWDEGYSEFAPALTEREAQVSRNLIRPKSAGLGLLRPYVYGQSDLRLRPIITD